jgi:hypothetical protein
LRQLSESFGVKRIDGILGTTLFYHFRATLDYPQGELVLRRKDAKSLEQFAAESSARSVAVPFWMASDHFMVGWGRVATLPPGLYDGPFPWENSFGFNLAGMVGHDFFKPYAVTFDFEGMQISAPVAFDPEPGITRRPALSQTARPFSFWAIASPAARFAAAASSSPPARSTPRTGGVWARGFPA